MRVFAYALFVDFLFLCAGLRSLGSRERWEVQVVLFVPFFCFALSVFAPAAEGYSRLVVFH